MNPDLLKLQSYPFQKLAALKQGVRPNAEFSAIDLSIGEPKHDSPAFLLQAMADNLADMQRYTASKGTATLREAVAQWLLKRFHLPPGLLDPERHVLPVNGTREALFSFAQAVIDRREKPLVIMPNPFYQIYEGAALLAGAQPYYLNADPNPPYQIDVDRVPADVWQRCQLFYLCNPYNPTGAVFGVEQMIALIDKAQRYDFIIAADECYSEIYFKDAPPGLLQAAAACGNGAFERCVVFHSLSKRSNVPGLRSGFVAGDAGVLEQYLLYRTYHGCSMSLPAQTASISAWRDEDHVIANRRQYLEKFQGVLEILQPHLDVAWPQAGFYLWPRLPGPDAEFAKKFYAEYNVTLLPGSYLSRPAHDANPGECHARVALVASLADCLEMARRLKAFLAE